MGRTSAGRFSGGLGYAPTISTEALLSAPNGYSTLVQPRAVHAGGKTFFGYIDGSGNAEVAEYDEVADTVSTPTLIRAMGADVHNAPALVARASDDRIVVAVTGHSISTIYISISTNPLDATAFGAATSISAQIGSGSYTYCSLAEPANGPLHLFFRNNSGGTARLCYSTSSDGGTTWVSQTQLVTAAASANVGIYWAMAWDAENIHLFWTDSDRVTPAAALYHGYLRGGSLYQTNGTLITGTLPYARTAGTLVKDNSDGSINPCGAGVEPDGTPFVVYMVYKSATPTNQVWVSRYRSGAWQSNQVADQNGLLQSYLFEAGAAVASSDPNVVFTPRKVGSYFEMHRYVSADDGSTWTGTQLTSGSSADAALPAAVRTQSALRTIWHRGTITSSTDFSLNTEGWRAG